MSEERRAALARAITLDGRPAALRDAGNGFVDLWVRGNPRRRIRTCWASVEHVVAARRGEFWS